MDREIRLRLAQTTYAPGAPGPNEAVAPSRPLSDFIALGCLVLPVDPKYFHDQTDTQNTHWSPVTVEDRRQHCKDYELVDNIILLIHSGWVRAFAQPIRHISSEVWRIHLLADDVARSTIEGRNIKDARRLQNVLPAIHTSPVIWNEPSKLQHVPADRFDVWATPEDGSSFYLFNTLRSPSPNPDGIANQYLRRSVIRLLEDEKPQWGLKSLLHPYQRRSAAMMIQKENVQSLLLDPRLEKRVSPNGDTYYYGPREHGMRGSVFYKSPRYYESCQGGVLAETMGLGKTLICIAVIMLTRGQYAAVPVEFEGTSTHPGPRSLTDMASSAVIKTGLPYKTFFEDHRDYTDDDLLFCKAVMDRQQPKYEIPPRIIRSMRHAEKRGPVEEIRLCHGTIVVVPPNLVGQWQAELNKHVGQGALKVLVMKQTNHALPDPEELATYDVVLFSRTRFEKEAREISDVDYSSPLKKLHWLRIIVDEGHGFSSSTTNAAVVANKLVRAERRWIVSGTPARDLLGVEVDVAAMASCANEQDFRAYKQTSLTNRKHFDSSQEQTSGAIKSIGALVSKFLQAQPWCLSLADEGGASWEDHVYRHEDHSRRTNSSFSQCLRTTLNDIMVKTRPEDVEKDIRLPPLRHDIVRLQPSTIDKMTANVFVLLYTTNAVTSERRDQDYLFHSNNRDHLQRLTKNMRQSAFYWSGFGIEDIAKSIETGEKYLDKHGTSCEAADRYLLTDTIAAARQMIASLTFRGITGSQDMAMFLEDWPTGSEESWTFAGCQDPPVARLALVLEAQKIVNNQLAMEDPLTGFGDMGKAAMIKAHEEELALAQGTLIKEEDKLASKRPSGFPSAVYSDGMGSKRVSVTGTSRASPKKQKRKSMTENAPEDASATKTAPRKKRRLSIGSTAVDLSPSDDLGRTSIVGTASSKLSYLIDRVSTLYEQEKILIFFDAEPIAYYTSQALDLLNIKHLIYATGISSEQRSKYIVLFNEDPAHRVLLMDLKQAAHGLNLSSASRVFFVNPPWRPDVEAQAIKRAHRIGQTRPVHVETLVLQGTVEEAMFERAAMMTRREHLAVKSLEEDADIRHIIQNARVLPIDGEEMTGRRQMAPLQMPQQLFGRPGRAGKSKQGKLEEEVFGNEDESPVKKGRGKGKGKQRKTINSDSSMNDMTSLGHYDQQPNMNGVGAGSSAAAAASIFGS